jgi:DNA-damage-inducible protein J
MSSTIQIRVDDDLKQKSDLLFKELGTDTTTAIRIFLTQAIAHNGFPFEIKRSTNSIYKPLSESEMLERIEASKELSDKGFYRDADVVIADMRAKYGL